MNCISTARFASPAFLRNRVNRTIAATLALLGSLLLVPLHANAATQADRPNATYDLEYTLTAVPDQQAIDVRMRVKQKHYLLREMRFSTSGLEQLSGDGQLIVDDEQIRWQPPEQGGELRWRARVHNTRESGGYDAYLDSGWGLFRAEDVIPRASTRALKSAHSNTTLSFKLPKGWSAVTEYRSRNHRFAVASPGRRFVQPSGWIVIGELGVRRDRIAGSRVAVAAPIGENVRRMDMLALLNWTLPELARVLLTVPPRITIVSAGRPMWRGGLSAPQSLYIHADRPLISENGTSTLLHEVMHLGMRSSADNGYDWIVEGMAEYYSLQLLVRSGTLTQPRFKDALESLADWAKSADTLCAPASTGARTALAVNVLHALNEEIAAATRGKNDLDDVLRNLLEQGGKFNLAKLRSASRQILSKNPDSLHSDRLPGCSKLATSN